MRKRFKSSLKVRLRARAYMARRRREHPLLVKFAKINSRKKRWREARTELQAQEKAARARYAKKHPRQFKISKRKAAFLAWRQLKCSRRRVSFKDYLKGYYKRKARARKLRNAKENARHRSVMFKRWQQRERTLWPLATMIRRVRNRAKRYGVRFTIKASDLLVNGRIPKRCPVLGLKLNYRGRRGNGYSRHKHFLHPNYASVDRIRPTRGYVPGNVLIVSVRANIIKRDATPVELRRIADFYCKLLKRA
jgi:hypothetical protein